MLSTVPSAIGRRVRAHSWMYSLVAGGLISVVVAMTTGCDSSHRAFQDAQRQDEMDSYRAFLAKYPKSADAQAAKERLDYLQAIASAHETLQGSDAAAKVDVISTVRHLQRRDDLLQLVPLLIPLLEDHRLFRVFENIEFRDGFAVAGPGPGPGVMRVVSLSSEAAETLEFITGQQLGKDQEKWKAWWSQQPLSQGRIDSRKCERQAIF